MKTSSAFSFAQEQAKPDLAVWEYNGVKERHPDDMVLYQMGDFFELYGEDAKEAVPELGLQLVSRAIPGGGRVEMCGFPANRLEQYLVQLRAKHDVTVSATLEGSAQRREYSILSTDHEAEQDINDHEAEYGADGFWAFRDEEAIQAASIRELHEQYKPIVLEAVIQDTRYRNACGHSDYENAVIEGNAAIRRAVLGSDNMGLLRLYSDTPEFRQRLHREVIDETYPKLHELLHPLSDNDIDRAIQEWNGKIESKHAVVRYMKDHAREKDTAAWLAHEFDGGDGKTPFAVRPESPEGTALPWPKVQRRIAQLIKENRFYTQVEQDNLDDVDPIAIRETLAQRGIVDGHVEDPEKLDNDPFVQQVMRDVEAISRETAQAEQSDQTSPGNSRVPVSDEEYAAARGTVRERNSYDPAVPPYHVGDIVYLDDRAHQITELRDDTVQLLPTGMSYPIYRAESRERFEQLLREDNRNDFYTEFLPANLDTVDQDLRDVLAHGLIGEADKAELSELLHNGKSNQEVALWLSRAYPNIVETMELETGDTADYRTMPEGIELEVLDAEEKRLAMLFFRWDEVAPLLRGLYARQLDGFGQERPELATEPPAYHAETVAVYPGDKNHLPYDVVVQTLRTNEPEPPAPAAEPEKTLDEVLDEHPVFVQVNGEWQTFPNVKAAEEASYEEYKANLRRTAENFRITDDHLGEGGPKAKFQANIEAIKLLKYLEETTGQATPEQQQVLSRYVGWGGLANCFEQTSPHYEELKSLLDSEEYAAARASSLTAFYTPPVVIRGIYKALSQMGFTQGNILEPSCGTGNFLGLLPADMAGSKAYGVELDSISGRIAGQLYQNASISVNGFETVQMPDSFFDVAVGNVPFGDFKVLDKRYDKHHWLIHDYFFGKTLDKVRPGGIVAFITSKGTLDKENSAVRKYLAQRADLIGAIRLPDNTFRRNAGTEVTSDIIFLQKRDHITDLEQDWVHLDTDENGIRMNRYFVQHPEMILGDMVMESTRFGPDSACKAREGEDLSEQLANAIQFLQAEIKPYELEELDEEDPSIPADPTVKNFSYTLVDGQVYYRENSLMHPVEVSVTAENRIRGMIELRECVRRLIEYQTEGYPDEDIAAEQQKLNVLYDSFTAKYGLINSRGNKLAFSEDSSYCLLCSLEVLDEQGNLKRKADMFSKRTIRPHVAVTSVDTASEALAVSISEKARVDMDYMAELSGKSPEELEQELAGVIYRDIRCAENPEDILPSLADLSRYPLVTADEYLSGKVRQKLRMAKAFLEVAPDHQKEAARRNVEALEAVKPQDLGAGEIGVRIGANWVPVEVYQQFMVELLTPNYYVRDRIRILRSEATGQWSIREKNADRSNVKANTTYGTKRMSAYHILEQTLNQKDVRVFDYIEDENGKKKPVLNKKETAIAQDRQELIKQKFIGWVWKDIDRRELLCRIYNETFNGIRPREYDGRHIRFEGMNPEISLRPHQINAIAHILYGGNTLLAHEVGAGKTYEMVAAAMEMKRLGLCTKSLIVVPNHITEQWAAEWLQLYPSANILVATKKDFETQNRKKFCSRIATGDYDAIIIGHSQFEKIPMSVEAILERQIEEILFGIEQAKAQKAERYTVKQMERTRKSLETKLAKLNDQSRKDDVVTFEQLGVDRLFIDESHYFKNLFLATKMRNVGGIAQTEAQKSSDLFMKCQYLDELTGGRGVIFATGTPISNSMVELYTIQRYLQYRLLQELGLIHFDDWASNFGETVTAI